MLQTRMENPLSYYNQFGIKENKNNRAYSYINLKYIYNIPARNVLLNKNKNNNLVVKQRRSN